MTYVLYHQKETPIQGFSFELFKIFKSKFFRQHLEITACERALGSTVPIAIANNISKANYQKGFVLYAF